ncbi:uncharacterized protein LOC133299839 [Gastrolobium bilobum]|uniref:uncharacterized protein LOC133299839 n=1 Tax=Gastrolobium bilobum TaxID=150636 RepID=UPI002AB28A70|nr:uncharacterized protein LOC133299839 [Gastrolobium bilobum]
MGRPRIKLHNLCIGHAKPRVRASSSFSVKYENRTEFSSNGSYDYGREDAEKGAETGNKIMVVVDSSFESKGALEWALSHTVQSQDTVVLVHVARSTRKGAESDGKFNLKAYQLLFDMKSMCEKKRPGVLVNVVMLEGEDNKGAAIVQEAKQQMVSLLVVGQKKRSILWRLMRRWSRKRTNAGVVEYCIQNSPCMTIAVRRKNKKIGGYLITTKRHKKFWLLA